MVPLYPGPAAPSWATAMCSGSCELEIGVTLEKYEDDGLPRCVFRVGAYMYVTIRITNTSDTTYRFISGNGKFSDFYLYAPHRGDLVSRMSWHQGYDDDTLFLDLVPGETVSHRRIWIPRRLDYSLVPAGTYDVFGRLEPWREPEPQFTRADPTLSPRFTISLVD